MDERTEPPTEYLIVEEVAQRERVAPRTVVHWIRTEKLHALRKPGTRRWLIPVWAYWKYKHGA
jgi:hypothetical protein